MSGHNDPTRRVPFDQLGALVTSIFLSCGMRDQDASLLADSLAVADLGGVHSHGVLRVPEYVKKVTAAGVDPRGTPSVVSQAGGCLVVNGGNSMGQIGCRFAMEQVIERAGDTGLAAAAVRGSNHCGALAYFAEMALPHDMIGFATTNALPTMAPEGGAERILGIDPVAFAIPADQEPPIVYDAALAGSAHGKIRVYAQKGWTLPAGWALDANGQPTTDPVAAIDGLLIPIGGYKGASLAMIMGILSSMLSGAAYGTELGNMEDGPIAGKDGHFLMAIKIAAFEDVRRFKQRVDAAIRQVHESRRAHGINRLFVPGEKEFHNRRAYLREGIPLNNVTLADLARTAQSLGVPAPAYPWLAGLLG